MLTSMSCLQFFRVASNSWHTQSAAASVHLASTQTPMRFFIHIISVMQVLSGNPGVYVFRVKMIWFHDDITVGETHF